MNRYILFSALGFSDPTRGFHDGAFIHICRFYRPEKAYLYMSKEICELDMRDNRYERYLQKLCEKLNFPCTIHKIKKYDLVSVDHFDSFYSEFTKIIEHIADENPDCKIITNLSSGTPQMKSALKLISSISRQPVLQVQVSSPEGKSNTEPPVAIDYDFELEWELNEDNNNETPVNRCTISNSTNLHVQIKQEIIKKHIGVYDYRAALTVARSISDFMEPEALCLIEAAERRLSLNTKKAEALSQSSGYKLIPLNKKSHSQEFIQVYEYILSLQIKLEKGELADFVRAVSPVITDLFEMYLKKCGIPITNYYLYSSNRAILSRRLLPPDLTRILDAEFHTYSDTEPCAANLYPIIAEKGERKAADITLSLRGFEKKTRNIAAHEIITVTEDWIFTRSGFTSSEILNMLKQFLCLCGTIPDNAWDSYKQLNNMLIEKSLLK